MNILAEIRSRFQAALSELTDSPEEYLSMIRPSQDPRFGDFQANCAMPLAKRLGRNPRELAAEIVARLSLDDLCTTPEIAGPGFINLRVRDDWLQEEINRLPADERLGVPAVAQPQTIVLDYSAPNVAKPMHVGHLRSTVLGAALYNVLQFLGHCVIGDNHIGDWGTQFGMIIYGYKHFRNEDALQQNPVEELARLYRLVNELAGYQQLKSELPCREQRLKEKQQEAERLQAAAEADPADKKASKAARKIRSELADLSAAVEADRKKIAAVEADPLLSRLAAEHPDIAEKSRQETAKLHAGDAENTALWRRFLPECLQALQRIYNRLGVHFDETLGESFYQPMLADVVDDLLQKKIAEESEGAVCVFNEGFAAPFIVRKSDGAFTYATTDLATIKYRVEHFRAEKILYVVDARQSEHFEQLFTTARRWGYREIEYRHIKFGTILDKNTRKPFRTRAGDTVGLESLLDEAHARARAIVDANDDAKGEPELSEEERDEVAEAVGIGGLKYADLHHNRESDYAFDWEKMLAKEGDTATYMQYAYARICGIFRKGDIAREELRSGSGRMLFSHEAERALALQILRFAEVVWDVIEDYRPNLLTQYLFALANQFSTFYEKCPVLKEADEAIRFSRLLLCDTTARVIRRGLSLLGIQTCERM